MRPHRPWNAESHFVYDLVRKWTVLNRHGPELGAGTPPKSEFRKKSPEINVSTIDLDALKI